LKLTSDVWRQPCAFDQAETPAAGAIDDDAMPNTAVPISGLVWAFRIHSTAVKPALQLRAGKL
jgi:hypothetical protein